MENKFKDIENYGIIGNLETCALIGSDGSIDWMCLPYLESPSIFAAILDNKRGGHFAIQPVSKFSSFQVYIKETNILQTTFNTPFGMVTITDFMPVNLYDGTKHHRTLYRKVKCIEGHIRLELSFKPRFNYAKDVPDFKLIEGGALCSFEDNELFLNTVVPLKIKEDEITSQFNMRKDMEIWFVLQYNQQDHYSPEYPPDYDKFNKKLDSLQKYWQNWTYKCQKICILEDIWHDIIARSGLVLKLLANPESGAIAAAATTSLPECTGGVRNWDYRYAWIRDSAYTIQALFHLEHVQESQDYMRWINSIIKQDTHPSDIRIMYPLHKDEAVEEQMLEYLSGYKQSSPVRIGNAAVNQKQLDIYGELINAIYDTTRYGKDISDKTWEFIKNFVDYICEVWNTKDRGIWEIRGEAQHYVHSKLMCWVAVDRGIKIAKFKKTETSCNWEETKNEIETAILEKGFNKELNSFVQSFDSNAIDATTLLIPRMGLLPYDDPRVHGTIEAVMKNLMTEKGLVYRYKNEDGLPGDEGCFLLCSFWLVDSLALSGRLDEAISIFVNVLQLMSPLGLLAEEIDPKTGKLLGNFPQAFSHIGLVNSALYIGIARGRKHKGPKPQGFKHSVPYKEEKFKIKK
ncbi:MULTISPECIES: glycoside hydrolase family 15 protein [Methanobacterium]|uniref:Glycoside hydrolase family 15 protein n=1 Tax=Methanobacterium veterum TaxID=408577 RepID=A0A9E5A3I8_9EURY|nr:MULTISPECIES: glycoside hydrolase family 15 protein [Methanobacterium]MCZ3366428.1 glycoside hydrolase family 15 protein [Methanobacterium veterum]MCZ3371936.1 glycoside hydrolase family 15 protein [Methanobacterium veterum]